MLLRTNVMKIVLLIGESGTGKTAIVESLALYIRNEANDWLKGKTIFNAFFYLK